MKKLIRIVVILIILLTAYSPNLVNANIKIDDISKNRF